MPTSWTGLDPVILADLKKIQPQSALDVGTGYGKIGGLIKQANAACAITGFEVFKDYITSIPVGIYQGIINDNFYAWAQRNVDWATDLIFFGDVLEHFTQSQGRDLLEMCNYRSKWIAITTPETYIQNSEFGNTHEAHISRWLLRDLANYNVVHYVKDLTTHCYCTYILIRGLI